MINFIKFNKIYLPPTTIFYKRLRVAYSNELILFIKIVNIVVEGKFSKNTTNNNIHIDHFNYLIFFKL